MADSAARALLGGYSSSRVKNRSKSMRSMESANIAEKMADNSIESDRCQVDEMVARYVAKKANETNGKNNHRSKKTLIRYSSLSVVDGIGKRMRVSRINPPSEMLMRNTLLARRSLVLRLAALCSVTAE